MVNTRMIYFYGNYIEAADSFGVGDALYTQDSPDTCKSQFDLDKKRTCVYMPTANGTDLRDRLFVKPEHPFSYSQGDFDAHVFSDLNLPKSEFCKIALKNGHDMRKQLKSLSLTYVDDNQIPCGFSLIQADNSDESHKEYFFMVTIIKNILKDPAEREVYLITDPRLLPNDFNLHGGTLQTINNLEESRKIIKEKINSHKLSDALDGAIRNDIYAFNYVNALSSAAVNNKNIITDEVLTNEMKKNMLKASDVLLLLKNLFFSEDKGLWPAGNRKTKQGELPKFAAKMYAIINANDDRNDAEKLQEIATLALIAKRTSSVERFFKGRHAHTQEFYSILSALHDDPGALSKVTEKLTLFRINMDNEENQRENRPNQ